MLKTIKTKIIGVGITGLVGSRIVELTENVFDFINASSETGVDITDYSTIIGPIEKSDAKILIHLAAKTNVDSCENDKKLGKEGPAWKINVGGTKNVIEACRKSNKKIIYFSTDYVFDGTKEKYRESDTPRPINWYAQTKYEGELLVKNSGLPYLICRITYPYRAKFSPKKDFVRTLIDNLNNKERVYLMIDHIFTPTFIDDIAQGIKLLIEKNETGTYHLVGSQSLTPYDAGLLIAEEFNLDKSLIEKTTSTEYLKDKAHRPLKLASSNDKITSIGGHFSGFAEGIKIVKKQMEEE